MVSLVIFFSLIVILGGLWIWFFKNKKVYIATLISGEPNPDVIIPGEKKRVPKFFITSTGEMINLRKHKELAIFHVLGDKDVLVETWGRDRDIALSEGKTLIAIFKIQESSEGRAVCTPVLRRFESLIVDQTEKVWDDYKQENLGVTWKDGSNPEVLPGENLIGIVKYEGV